MAALKKRAARVVETGKRLARVTPLVRAKIAGKLEVERGRAGKTLDAYMDERGVREEVETLAAKRVIAAKLEEAMERRGVTRAQLAELMGTSRSQIGRLLSPTLPVQTDTVTRAAKALRTRIRVEFR